MEDKYRTIIANMSLKSAFEALQVKYLFLEKIMYLF